jgi:hypothetical protein
VGSTQVATGAALLEFVCLRKAVNKLPKNAIQGECGKLIGNSFAADADHSLFHDDFFTDRFGGVVNKSEFDAGVECQHSLAPE